MKILAVQGLLRRSIPYAAFALILFGLKLLVISQFGNRTPFGDQWPGEADEVFAPLLKHSFGWKELLAPHNEHRILFTRLLVITLLRLNRLWDPLLEMVSDAMISIVGICILTHLLTRPLHRSSAPTFFAFGLFAFGIPFGWQNILWGFQSQFYFLIIFSLLSIWMFSKSEPMDQWWWGGMGCSAAAFFSMASGSLVMLAMVSVGVLQGLIGIGRTKKNAVSVVVMIACFLIATKYTPDIFGADALKLRANNFSEFYHGILTIIAWPMEGTLTMALLGFSPTLALITWVIMKRPRARDPVWHLVGLAIWSLGQAAAVAYERSTGVLTSRYLDIICVSVATSWSCALVLLNTVAARGPRMARAAARLCCAAWVVMVVAGMTTFGLNITAPQMIGKKEDMKGAEENIRQYLLTNDPRYADKKLYPDTPAFLGMLDIPEVRSIMPSNIRKPLGASIVLSSPEDVFVRDGVYVSTPHREDAIGSYGKGGDMGIGEAVLRIDGVKSPHWIRLPVAGYPSRAGMGIRVLEGNKERPVWSSTNPGERWDCISFRVGKGATMIKLVDNNPTTWMAVGAPVLIGDLERFTEWMLRSWWIFIELGIAIGMFSILIVSSFRKTTHLICNEIHRIPRFLKGKPVGNDREIQPKTDE